VVTEAVVEVDFFGPFNANEHHMVLLCSVGLYRTVTGEDLSSLATVNGNLEEAAKALVASALRNGSDDNITAALVRFGGPV
jgi:PPM family protein phosphatase